MKNRLNDLIGAFGELMLWRLTRERFPEAAAYIRSRLYVPDSGHVVSGCDLVVGDWKVDVKTHDCAPNKKYFATNARKHEQLRGACTTYWCLFAPPYARHALIANPVPYEAVDHWATQEWQYGDPARVLPLPEFLAQYCPGAGPFTTDSVYDALSVQLRASEKAFQESVFETIPELRAVRFASA